MTSVGIAICVGVLAFLFGIAFGAHLDDLNRWWWR